MKINYKITTIGLAGILLITYAWHWEDMFFHDKNKTGNGMNMKGEMNGMRGMHQMEDNMMMGDDKMDKMNMQDTMSSMTGKMQNKSGKELEQIFLREMIMHHDGAVEMAKKLIEDKTVDIELVKFSNQIISAQSSEIKMMNTWLNTKYK